METFVRRWEEIRSASGHDFKQPWRRTLRQRCLGVKRRVFLALCPSPGKAFGCSPRRKRLGRRETIRLEWSVRSLGFGATISFRQARFRTHKEGTDYDP